MGNAVPGNFSGFIGMNSLKKVVLPEGLDVIGPSAFRECKNSSEINIPSTCTIIGLGAFSLCSSLEKISISEDLVNFIRGNRN